MNITNTIANEQIHLCVTSVKAIFGKDLLGMYLYGSAIAGGLQKYSDIDLFIITSRTATSEEKAKLAAELLIISGIYMKGEKPPIELTIVSKSAINPWHYPPTFDFQYGEWLRGEFEKGNIEPWPSKEMPDLVLLITQVLLASKTLVGESPERILPKVPYKDFIAATADALPNLISELESDTRNVLLTLARIWSTVATDTIRPKPAAADWAIAYLPVKYQPVLQRAKAICIGEEREHWDDIREHIKPCADHMIDEINKAINEIHQSDIADRTIRIDKDY